MAAADLPSTAAEIVRQCPRFRILVIGKSGVGKSTLISRAFNVDVPSISNRKHGRCDIHEEIHSVHNPLFVLHDSQGFEPGEVENLTIVKDFIHKRSQQPELKDRLHAIWLCIEIPHANGRLFEIGDEEFLKLNHNVPVVVVFTKSDLLDINFQLKAHQKGRKFNQKDADNAFERLCVAPLNNVRQQVPYARVSTSPKLRQYRDTLPVLIEITRKCIDHHVKGDLWILYAIAQRASVSVNIKASIEVGMKKYWYGLAASASFSGSALWQCLEAIHTDIVAVWNFRQGPDDLLLGDKFKSMMMELVADLGPRDASEDSTMSRSLDVVGKAVGVVTPLAAPLTMAIAIFGVSAMFANWLSRIYSRTPETLRCLMGYIFDLTLMLDKLFWVEFARKTPGVPLSTVDIEDAFHSYKDSEERNSGHREIRNYVDNTPFAQHLSSNNAHQEVVRLIKLYCLMDVTVDTPDPKPSKYWKEVTPHLEIPPVDHPEEIEIAEVPQPFPPRQPVTFMDAKRDQDTRLHSQDQQKEPTKVEHAPGPSSDGTAKSAEKTVNFTSIPPPAHPPRTDSDQKTKLKGKKPENNSDVGGSCCCVLC